MLDICYASVHELQEAYREGTLTVKEVVMAHMARIAKIDSCEGGLRSVIELNPDALFMAERLDRVLALQENKILSPLFGIPILIKDNISTWPAGRMRTSAGSLALANHYGQQAFCLWGLESMDAIILGKTNMTEFANYMTSEGMPSGYSSRGGQTLCPYNRAEDPSGSSTGSAVAVAAGLSTLSIGTETSGSIISPAGANGVVGIKPTLGLVSRQGVIPISSTFDTPGPMARNVSDAALLLGIMSGVCHIDMATKVWPQSAEPTEIHTPTFHMVSTAAKDYGSIYKQSLTGERLDGVRIGLNRAKEFEHWGMKDDDEAKAAFDSFCDMLKSAGATLVDNLEMEPRYDTRRVIMQHEFKACMNYYLHNTSPEMRTLADIIKFNQANAATALKYGQSLLLDAQNKFSGNLTEPAYIEALLEREKAIAEMDNLFDQHNLDVLLGDVFVYIAPFTGFPSMTIPTGQRQKNNMPLRASFTARRLDEAKMINVAYVAEKMLGLNLRPEL